MQTSVVYKLEAPYQLTKVEECLDTEKLGDEEIYAQTEYSVISKGTELAAWQGQPPLRQTIGYPRLLGYCNLARVIRLGKKVKNILPGEYILSHQPHRTAFICSQSEILFHIKQVDEINKKKLTALYLYYLAYHSLLTGNFKPGFGVAVIGLGVLGHAVASLVKIFGSEPLIFSDQVNFDSPAFYKFKNCIYPKSIQNPETVFPSYVGQGADLVINTSNKWSDHLLGLTLAKKGAEIVCLGFPGRGESTIPFNPLDSQFFYAKGLSIKHCGYPQGLTMSESENFLSAKRGMHYLADLIALGKLDPDELISFEVPWDNLESAYQKLTMNKPGLLTGLLKW